MPGYEIIDSEERQEVNSVFDSGGVLFRYGFEALRNNTYKVVEFENKFAEFLHAQYAQATTSGTASLFAINKIFGIGKGDEVITQSFTFVATVEAILETGATPVICEVDETLNMDPIDLEKRITKKTKAIWVVHMMGVPARISEIARIAKKYRLFLLEDTAQSLGAKYNGQFCGTFGDAGAFSFDFGKTLTTGDGGMIVVPTKKLYLAARAYCDHGHEDNPKFPRGEDTATRSGFNFRMMELQGAVGLAQLRKLPKALSQVKKNYKKLENLLKGIPEIEFRKVPKEGEEVGDSLTFFLPTAKQRKKVSDYLTGKKIGFKLLPGAVKWHFAGRWDHIWDVYPRYAEKNYLKLWPKSYELLQRAIAIPIMINLSQQNIEYIASSIQTAVKDL
ncbi:DegT/DnrJ/EryC1/StrS family aminotransferase [Candidatus Gottesmanbacteria bacterium]|nr:DegT/DnrJ/EryC1/StrS family aminotransferase [Candidatus Gottesmanbacteria bacterium]